MGFWEDIYVIKWVLLVFFGFGRNYIKLMDRLLKFSSLIDIFPVYIDICCTWITLNIFYPKFIGFL
jgi:hypothetical protein